MKKTIGILIVLALVITMLSAYIKEELEKANEISEEAKGKEVVLNETVGIEKGNLAPDFTLYNLQGKPLTLSDLRGKRVVLNFWTTWCPPCKAEMPHMQKYYEQYSDEDNVEIVGVNLTFDRDKVERVEQFVKSYDITFPIVFEPDGSIASLYQIITIPSTFMIDEEGKIQKQIVGPLDLEMLRENVNLLN